MLIRKSDIFERAERAVVTLHGYGSQGSDFVDPVVYAMSAKIKNTLFVFPDAPHKCAAGFGLEWFKLSNSITFEEIRTELEIAAPALFNDVILKIVEEQKIPLENINVIGFSQGAMLAFEMLYYANFAHIVAYSGLFAFDSKKDLKYKENKVLIVHSDDDRSMPYSNLKMSSDSLNIIGIQHKTHTCHNIGHSISAEGFEQGVDFILNE